MTATRRVLNERPHRRPAPGRGEPHGPTIEEIIVRFFAIIFLLVTLVEILRDHLRSLVDF